MNTRRLLTVLCIGLLSFLFLPPSFPGRAAPVPPDHYPDYDVRTQLPWLASQRLQMASSFDLASASELADWSKLVFQSYRDSNWEIYIASPGGANQQRLTNNAAADIHPRLNRGGTRVVFASKRTGSYEIYVLNVDGTGLTRFTYTGTDNVNPAWSPDGERVAFESYRDGQAEIYVMNADGSNQTRLTWDSAYDGDPAWSSDGKRIAFASRRTGGDRIWVIQADGSGPVQISTQNYSENPSWSPDGKWFAYDADYDGDGWQEIIVMDVPGWTIDSVYNPDYPNMDAWVGSWAPDSNSIAYTEVIFVYYQGNWYWREAYVCSLPREKEYPRYPVDLIPQDTEWSPDWQTLDVQPPTPLLTVLSESPSPIVVNYSGQDLGGSGIKDFDVQYRKSEVSTWTDLVVQMPDSYPLQMEAVGGETYYFRMRVRDNAYNVSAWSAEKVATVETYPPQSQVNALPGYTRYTAEGFPVFWSVVDPGGSDIVSLEVEYRRDSQPWQHWLSNVSPPVTFYGETGHMYAFRTRAVDRAQNAELWPEGDGDTQTTLYTWGITGKVTDNAGVPVSSAVISTTPAAMQIFTSLPTGDYGAYVLQNEDWYTFTMQKSGYGIVPATAFPLARDARLDMVLSPVDNVVQDWGFESGDMGGVWQVSGFTMPVAFSNTVQQSSQALSVKTEEGLVAPLIVSDVVHTGNYAALMGLVPSLMQQDTGLSDVAGPSFVMDEDGRIHIFYSASNTEELFYRYYEQSTGWSDAERVSSGTTLRIVVINDAVEVVYRQYAGDGKYVILVAKRRSDGSWEAPYQLTDTASFIYGFDVATDRHDHVHFVWSDLAGRVYYREQNSSGNLLVTNVLAEYKDRIVQMRILPDTLGNIHVVGAVLGDGLYYIHRDPLQIWHASTKLVNMYVYTIPEIAVDDKGILHIVWAGLPGSGVSVFYTSNRNGVFARPLELASENAVSPKLIVGKEDEVHVFWKDNGLYHVQILEDGTWSKPVVICDASKTNGDGDPRIVLDDDGVLYAAWGNWPSDWNWEIYTADWTSGRGWSKPNFVTSTYLTSSSLEVYLLAQAGQRVYLFWQHGDGGYQLSQAAFPVASATGVYDISQTITVPITMSTPLLSFLYQLGGISDPATECFEVQVQDAVANTVVFSTTRNTLAWKHQSVNLASWQGQVITLTFRLYQSQNEMFSRAYLDEVSLGSARPDVWIAGTDTSGIPGEFIVYTIDYGNQGGGTAQAVRITNTLPAEMTFVDASILPGITTPSLVWNVGTLAPQSAASPIVVTVTLAPSVTSFTTLTHTLEIAPQDTGMSGTVMIDPGLVELEKINNLTTAGIYVGKHVYLPLILKKF